MKYLVIIIGLITSVFFFACGKAKNLSNFDLAKTARNAAPNFITTSTTSVKMNQSDPYYNNIKAMFTYCGDSSSSYEGQNAIDCGAENGVEINISNIYKLLFQTQGYIEGYANTCSIEVSDSQKMILNYDDGSQFISTDSGKVECINNQTESTNRYKGAAWKVDDTSVFFAVLYDHKNDNDEAVTYGTYNTETKELELTLALWGESGSYVKITGNTKDHTFTFHNGTCYGYGKSTRFSDEITINSIENEYVFVYCDNGADPWDKYCLKASNGEDITMNSTCESYEAILKGDNNIMDLPWKNGQDYSPTQHFSHEFSAID